MTEKQNDGTGSYRGLNIVPAVFIAIGAIAAAAAFFLLVPDVYWSIENEAAQTKNTITVSGAVPLAEAGELEQGRLYTFGSYPQNVPSGSDAAAAEPMPIVWRLLEAKNGRALLISEYLIDARPFDGSSGVWKESEMREWLCGEFLYTAFTSREREMLLTRSGDLVTLLNVGEAQRYFKTDEDRMAAPTLYAIRHGAEVGSVYKTESGLYTGWWWLRTPGFNGGMASFVDFSGSIYEGGDSADSTYYGVRPVITVSIQ